MPIYEYQCERCGEIFEIFQINGEEVEPKCPKCFGRAKRVISPVGSLVFKGSGFYITDYAKKDKDKGGKEEKKSQDKAQSSK